MQNENGAASTPRIARKIEIDPHAFKVTSMRSEPNGRRLQFRIGTMLWITALVAAVLFGIRERQLRVRYQTIAEVNPSKAYQVQLERFNALLRRELARAHELCPDFIETPLKVVPNQNASRDW
jgi:hypothetical protein